MKITQSQAERWLREWQQRLRVQDWTVAIKICRSLEMGIGHGGEVETFLKKKLAIISLLDPIDDDSVPDFPLDYEKTIVHELIHLHFEPFLNGDSNSAEHIAQEQAIDLLARSLVDLKREADSMAKKESKSKMVVPSKDGKMPGMKQPTQGMSKMAKGKGNGKNKGA